MTILQRIFRRNDPGEKSRLAAKERLKLVLVQDRVNMDHDRMEALKNDLIDVVDRYLDIDREAMEVSFLREKGSVSIVASLPVQNDVLPAPERRRGTA
ncbi:MAG: cell division topological specificity factor MinE [Bacillota bacterium]|jgi:cell division topological specificity factor